jgi:hypothetical protein
MPAGVRLLLEGLDKRLQRSLRVGATEEVVMIRHPFRSHTHRDGVRFANGREVVLQDLNAGLSAMLVPRDLTDLRPRECGGADVGRDRGLCAGRGSAGTRRDNVLAWSSTYRRVDQTALVSHGADVQAGHLGAFCRIGRSNLDQRRILGRRSCIFGCRRSLSCAARHSPPRTCHALTLTAGDGQDTGRGGPGRVSR